MRKEYLTKVKLIAILVCAFTLQVLFFSWMPGMQADATSAGVTYYGISHEGDFSLIGTSPPKLTLINYPFGFYHRLFGVGPFSLRLPYITMNVLTILLVYLFVRRLYNEEAGLICSLMMAIYPWFVIYLRVAWIPSYTPFVMMAMLYLLTSNRPVAHFFAGAVIGFACYHCIYFLTLPIVFLALFLLYHRKWSMKPSSVAIFLIGACLGYIPRIIHCLLYNLTLAPPSFTYSIKTEAARSTEVLHAVIKNTAVCVPYFLRIMDGSIIFLRTTGRVAVPVIPLNSLILIVSIYLLIKNKGRINRPLVISLLIFFALVVAMINRLTSIRYFTFALFVASLISGLGIYQLFTKNRRLGAGVLRLFVAVNLFYIIANFFIEFSRTGGSLTTFKAGNFQEMSHHHVRTDILYDALDKSVPVVVSHVFHIAMNIKFYDLDGQHFKIDKFIRPQYEEFYLVDYATGRVIDTKRFPDYEITREHPELKNFNIYRFRKK